ncbi:MAG TPA: pilus assembly protein N-terminal domain-containing protein, partial [Blastocatellia bacterium]|nr:pilus assembly protein N-terminal domain-containing protein [Blastocatellia bacterium]
MLVLTVALLAPIPLTQAASSAVSFVWSTINLTPLRQEDSQEQAGQKPSRNYAPRVKLLVGNIRELTFDEAIVAVTVLEPNIAAAQTNTARTLVIKGLNAGETILIISGKNSRRTYVIQVVRPPRAARSNGNEARRDEPAESFSGFYGLHFSPGTDSAPSLLQHDFEFNQKLPGSRTLRASGEMFNFMGRGERGLARPLGGNFGVNRLRLGLDSPRSSFDLLDSELKISRLSFDNYTMRGLHLVSNSDSRLKGLEIFAGRARPQASSFNDGEGLFAGALAPVAQGTSWRIRAGAFFVSPKRQSAERESGNIWHTDARYAPNENMTAEAEAAYANGNLSWRARLDLRRGPFNFHSELLRSDPHSPLAGIGAQTAGRKINSLSLQWRPLPRFAASFSYNSTTNSPLSALRRIELNARTLIATASYTPARGTRLSFSFNQQELEQPATLALPFLLNLRTRTATFRYGQRIGHGWTNDFEARLIESREDQTAEQMTRGISLREQLRYSWRRGSVAGFINYKNNNPSLTGLILRNPLLLPAELRMAFTIDPARFLLTNRDALPELLSGVELPTTRSTEAGLRLQAAFSRLNLAGEARYGVGEILAHNERNLLATFSADFKLDAANSIQVNGARAFSFGGTEHRTALTVSYVHRFGSASNGGFQFSKLLGLSHGRIHGRVFFDLNGNGQDDPD